MRLVIAASLLAAVGANTVGDAWINTLADGLSARPRELKAQILDKARKLSENFQKENPEGGQASENPEFRFLPQYRGSAIAGGDATTWTGRCFSSQSAVSSAPNADGSVKITFTSSGLKEEGCVEDYDLMTVTGAKKIAIDQEGVFEVDWALPEDAREAEKWDLTDKGVRVFAYVDNVRTTMANLVETLKIFVPEETKIVDPVSARNNVDFMARYPQFKMEQRDPLSSVPPLEHQVHSGDFFGVIRLDGLDPVLAWGMGSTTGHTTTALWMDNEEGKRTLYITESTVTDSYWPTNGIQKTEYNTWLKQAEEASYNVVWAPLNKQYRAKFNEEAAVEFFKSTEGLDYGYRNMLWGWVDTLNDNYPCVPDDYSTVCSGWEYFESVFGILDRKAPELVNMFVNQAMNFRLGTSDLRFPEILQEGAKQGYEARAIPTIPEQDTWMYETFRYNETNVVEGRSMVCCVYVCSSWKAAGLFGDNDVNCGEFTNADDYSMHFFEDEYKQIIGRWTLELNRYNTREPYDHMSEKCASLAPNYEQDADC